MSEETGHFTVKQYSLQSNTSLLTFPLETVKGTRFLQVIALSVHYHPHGISVFGRGTIDFSEGGETAGE